MKLWHRARSAITGRFILLGWAKEHPDITIIETEGGEEMGGKPSKGTPKDQRLKENASPKSTTPKPKK